MPRQRSSGTGSEDPLIAGAGRNDPVSWRVLFDRSYRKLLVFATLRTGSPEQARLAVRAAVVRAIENVQPGQLEADGVIVVLLRSLSTVLSDADDPFGPGIDPFAAAPDPVPTASGAAGTAPVGASTTTPLLEAFAALPPDQREMLALLAATGSAEEAASVSGAPLRRVRDVAVEGCRALDLPGRERLVVERLRADAADPLSLPDAEDEAIVWAAASQGRTHRRGRRKAAVVGAVVAATACFGGLVLGPGVGRSVLQLAHGIGLPVGSPEAQDVQDGLAALKDAVNHGDRRAIQAAVVRVSAAFEALSPEDRKAMGRDVDDAILEAQHLLAGQAGPIVLAQPPVSAHSAPSAPTGSASGGSQQLAKWSGAQASAPRTSVTAAPRTVELPSGSMPVPSGLSSSDVEARLAANHPSDSGTPTPSTAQPPVTVEVETPPVTPTPSPSPRPSPTPSPSPSIPAPSPSPAPSTTPETPEATPVP